MIVKCEGSGAEQMAAWPPKPDDDYPGAALCNYCTYGVLFVRGTVHRAVSKVGTEGTAGRMRVHYVKNASAFDYPEAMAYTKKELV